MENKKSYYEDVFGKSDICIPSDTCELKDTHNKIDILGAEYKILFQTESENPKLKDANGLCEMYSKEIIIEDPNTYKNNPMVVSNRQDLVKKVMRHEIIHAFLGESGLRNNSSWAYDEEMVDWIAIQFPKILKVFEELKIL